MFNLRTTKVQSDNQGDTRWQYYIELFKGKKLIWTDYYDKEPTLKEVINSLGGK